MHRICTTLAVLFCLISALSPRAAHSADDKTPKPHSPPKPLVWLEDYRAATDRAKAEKKHVLLHFYRPEDQVKKLAPAAIDSVVNIESELTEPGIRERLDNYLLVKVPVQTEIKVKGKPIQLLNHGAFSELRNGPGLAVIDYTHDKAEYYGYVVSVVPFTPGKYYRFRESHIAAMLDLPPGTLTQRSMIFAVRIHPEHPASTTGENDPILLSEAKSHSKYQAQVRVQGHHHWESRFQRILGRLLGRGKSGMPVEVVAESWPSQDLMDSCVDCVASWRQSEGHWSAVNARQASYGYDIRQSDNGIWYATGIFREAK
ncbi:MAG: hypothetical protein IT427_13935 [Pirellulales bacterium]|nr:hypothetical protein [Pirellulales bacterium]